MPEGVDVARLVLACEAGVVSETILADVLGVGLGQLDDCLVNVLHATGDTHALGGEVGVCTSSVPVSLDGLGVEGGHNAVVLTQPGWEMEKGEVGWLLNSHDTEGGE